MSKSTDYVLVETVSMFRMRYLVEVPLGESDYALDMVVMNEAKEFSQKFIDESIVSHRVVSKKEALALCDVDNSYVKNWSADHKIETFFTPWVEDEKSNECVD